MQTLTNCTILTVDGQDRFYEDGRLTVEDGRITAVGRAEDLPLRGETVDLRGGLVLPGLINTHTHSHSSLFRNQADDLQPPSAAGCAASWRPRCSRIRPRRRRIRWERR